MPTSKKLELHSLPITLTDETDTASSFLSQHKMYEAWIALMRSRYHAGTLAKWKIRRLERIEGWTWGLPIAAIHAEIVARTLMTEHLMLASAEIASISGCPKNVVAGIKASYSRAENLRTGKTTRKSHRPTRQVSWRTLSAMFERTSDALGISA